MLHSLLLKSRDKDNKMLVRLKKQYTKKEFDEQLTDHRVHFKTIDNQKNLKANLIIMFDINVPNGEENNKSNKCFVHYLKLNDVKYLSFMRPTPPEGTHNYHCLSVMLTPKDISQLLPKLKKEMDRNHKLFKNLFKKQILNIKFTENNIIRENSFKVSKD